MVAVVRRSVHLVGVPDLLSSCTVHSTSVSPPRPSLMVGARSAPRGSRSASIRALSRRMSRTCAVRQAPSRLAERVDQLDEVGREVVAGDGRGTQQRLELPGQRPPLVVGAVGVEAAHERAVLALRAQVGVEAERRVGAASRAAGAAPGRPRAPGPAGRGRPIVALVGVWTKMTSASEA